MVFILRIFAWFLLFTAICCPSFADFPKRIISGTPAITEMLYALDLEAHIVGVTTNCNYPLEAKKKPKIGGFFLNLEKVVALKPDLVILDKGAQKKEAQTFQRHKLNVYTLNATSVKGVMEAVQQLGAVTGKRAKAEQVVEKMQREIGAIKQRVDNFRPDLAEVLSLWNAGNKKRKALVIVGFEPLVVVGGRNFIDDILKYAGVDNVAAGAWAEYPQYSFEKLVSDNPQYIIIPANLMSKQQIFADKRWQSLEAVKKQRVLFIDADVLSRPGPRVVEAIKMIADFIYK